MHTAIVLPDLISFNTSDVIRDEGNKLRMVRMHARAGRGGGGVPPRNLLSMHYEITSEATLRQTTSNKGGYK